jgi:hypothetical protein
MLMEGNNQGHYQCIEGLDVHEAEDGLVVFNPATDSVHHLNHTAGVIFELCSEPVSLDKLSKAVAELYELEQAPIEEIVTGLNQLVEEGVVVELHGD